MIDDALLKTFLSLMAFVAIIGIVLWYVKRKTTQGKVGQSEVAIRVVARQALSPKSYICIVQIGDGVFAVGVTEHSVTLLKDLSAPSQHPLYPNVQQPPSSAIPIPPNDMHRELENLFSQRQSSTSAPMFSNDIPSHIPPPEEPTFGRYVASIFSRKPQV